MIIQHNIAAVNAYRNLATNKSALNKNLEKLSSGYRINRSADDAAGLAISEQMRSKINGLDQATSNAKDAIGLVQTMEGALTETHSMLQRMTTLATQAANGTYNATSRASIQKEMNELGKEIDRIANNTDYNGIKPLAKEGEVGQVSTMTMQIGATKGETLALSGIDMTTSGIFGALDMKKASDITNADSVKNLSTEDKAAYGNGAQKAAQTALDKEVSGVPELKDAKVTTTVEADGTVTYSFVDKDGKKIGKAAADGIFTADTSNAGQPESPVANKMTTVIAKKLVEPTKKGGADAYDGIDGVVATGKQTDGTEYLQIEGGENADPTVNANMVVSNIQKAIDHVSSYRAELGAKQNRLEHTINNLKVTSENTTDAESRIRDTDMAKEIAAYTKNNILNQAAQSMLAQANQQPQGVLSLLS